MDFSERQIFNSMQVEIDLWKNAAAKVVKDLSVLTIGGFFVSKEATADLIALVNTEPGDVPVTDRWVDEVNDEMRTG